MGTSGLTDLFRGGLDSLKLAGRRLLSLEEGAGTKRKPIRGQQPHRLGLENLEPRILLSAWNDLAANDAVVTDGAGAAPDDANVTIVGGNTNTTVDVTFTDNGAGNEDLITAVNIDDPNPGAADDVVVEVATTGGFQSGVDVIFNGSAGDTLNLSFYIEDINDVAAGGYGDNLTGQTSGINATGGTVNDDTAATPQADGDNLTAAADDLMGGVDINADTTVIAGNIINTVGDIEGISFHGNVDLSGDLTVAPNSGGTAGVDATVASFTVGGDTTLGGNDMEITTADDTAGTGGIFSAGGVSISDGGTLTLAGAGDLTVNTTSGGEQGDVTFGDIDFLNGSTGDVRLSGVDGVGAITINSVDFIESGGGIGGGIIVDADTNTDGTGAVGAFEIQEAGDDTSGSMPNVAFNGNSSITAADGSTVDIFGDVADGAFFDATTGDDGSWGQFTISSNFNGDIMADDGIAGLSVTDHIANTAHVSLLANEDDADDAGGIGAIVADSDSDGTGAIGTTGGFTLILDTRGTGGGPGDNTTDRAVGAVDAAGGARLDYTVDSDAGRVTVVDDSNATANFVEIADLDMLLAATNAGSFGGVELENEDDGAPVGDAISFETADTVPGDVTDDIVITGADDDDTITFGGTFTIEGDLDNAVDAGPGDIIGTVVIEDAQPASPLATFTEWITNASESYSTTADSPEAVEVLVDVDGAYTTSIVEYSSADRTVSDARPDVLWTGITGTDSGTDLAIITQTPGSGDRTSSDAVVDLPNMEVDSGADLGAPDANDQANVGSIRVDATLGQTGGDGLLDSISGNADDGAGFMDFDNGTADGTGIVTNDILIFGGFTPGSVIEVENLESPAFLLPNSIALGINPFSLILPLSLPAGVTPPVTDVSDISGSIPAGQTYIQFLSDGTGFNDFYAIGNNGTKTLTFTIDEIDMADSDGNGYQIENVDIQGDLFWEATPSVATIALASNAPGTDVDHIENEGSVGQIIITDAAPGDGTTLDVGSISVGFDTMLLGVDEAVTGSSWADLALPPAAGVTHIVDAGLDGLYGTPDDFIIPDATLGGLYVEGEVDAANSTLLGAAGAGVTVAVSGDFGPRSGALPPLPAGFSATNTIETNDVEPAVGGSIDSDIRNGIWVGGDSALSDGFFGDIDIAGSLFNNGGGELFNVGILKIASLGADGAAFTNDAGEGNDPFASGAVGSAGSEIAIDIAGVFGDDQGIVTGYTVGNSASGVDGPLAIAGGGDGAQTADGFHADIDVGSTMAAGVAAGSDTIGTEEADDITGSLTAGGDVTGHLVAGDDVGSAATPYVIDVTGDFGTPGAPAAVVATGASPGDNYTDFTLTGGMTALIGAGTGGGGSYLGDILFDTDDTGDDIEDTVIIADNDVGDGSHDIVGAGEIEGLTIAAGVADGETGDILVDIVAGVAGPAVGAVTDANIATLPAGTWTTRDTDIERLLLRADGNIGMGGASANIIAARDDIENFVAVAEGGELSDGGAALDAGSGTASTGIDLDSGIAGIDGLTAGTPGAFGLAALAGGFNEQGAEQWRVQLSDATGIAPAAPDGDAGEGESIFLDVYAGAQIGVNNVGEIDGMALLADGQVGRDGEGTSTYAADDDIVDVFVMAGLADRAGTGEDILAAFRAGEEPDGTLVTGDLDTSSQAFNVFRADDNVGEDGVADSLFTAQDDIENLIVTAGTDSGFGVGPAGPPAAPDPTVDQDPTLGGTQDAIDEGGSIFTNVQAGLGSAFGNIDPTFFIADEHVGATDGSDDLVASGNIEEMTVVSGFSDSHPGNVNVDIFAGVSGGAVGLTIDQTTGATTSGSFDFSGHILDLAVRADGSVGTADGMRDIAADEYIRDLALIAEGDSPAVPGGIFAPLNGAAYMTPFIGDNANGETEQFIEVDVNAGARDFLSSQGPAGDDLGIIVAAADAWIGHSNAVPEGFNVWRADHDVSIGLIDAGLNDVDSNTTENVLVDIFAGIEYDGITVPTDSVGLTGLPLFSDLTIDTLLTDDNVGAANQVPEDGFQATADVTLGSVAVGGISRNGAGGLDEDILPLSDDFDEGGSFLTNVVAGWRSGTSTDGDDQAGARTTTNAHDLGSLTIGTVAVDDDLGEVPTLAPAAAPPHLPTYDSAVTSGNVLSAAEDVTIEELAVGQSFTSFTGDSYGLTSSVNTGDSVGDLNIDIIAGVEGTTFDPVRDNINDIDTSLPGGAFPQLAGGVEDVYNDDITFTGSTPNLLVGVNTFDGGVAPFIPDDPATGTFFEGNGNFNATFLAGSDIDTDVHIAGNFVGRDGVGGRGLVSAAAYLGATFAAPNTLVLSGTIVGDFVGSLNSGAFVPFDNSGDSPFNPNDVGPMQAGTVLTLGSLDVEIDVGRVLGGNNGVIGSDGITFDEAINGDESLADLTFLGTTTFSSTHDSLFDVNVVGRPWSPVEGQSGPGTVTPNPVDGDGENISVLSFGEIDGQFTFADSGEFNFVMANVDAITAIDSSGAAPGDPMDPATTLPFNAGESGGGIGEDMNLSATALGAGQGGLEVEFLTAGFDPFTRIDTGGVAPTGLQVPVNSLAQAPKTPDFWSSWGDSEIGTSAVWRAMDADPTNGLEVGDLTFALIGAGEEIDGDFIAQDDIIARSSGIAGTDDTPLAPNGLDADVAAGLRANSGLNPLGESDLFDGGWIGGRFVAGDDVGSQDPDALVLMTAQAGPNDANPNPNEGDFTSDFRLISGAEDQLASDALFDNFTGWPTTEHEADPDAGAGSNISAMLIASRSVQSGAIIDAGDVTQSFGSVTDGGLGEESAMVDDSFRGGIHAGAGVDLDMTTVAENDPDGDMLGTVRATSNIDASDMPDVTLGILAEQDIGDLLAGFGVEGGSILGDIIAEGDIGDIIAADDIGEEGDLLLAGGTLSIVQAGNPVGGVDDVIDDSLLVGGRGEINSDIFAGGGIEPGGFIGAGAAINANIALGTAGGIAGGTAQEIIVGADDDAYNVSSGDWMMFVEGGELEGQFGAVDMIINQQGDVDVTVDSNGTGDGASVRSMLFGDGVTSNSSIDIEDGSLGWLGVADDVPGLSDFIDSHLASLGFDFAALPEFFTNSIPTEGTVEETFNNDQPKIDFAGDIRVSDDFGIPDGLHSAIDPAVQGPLAAIVANGAGTNADFFIEGDLVGPAQVIVHGGDMGDVWVGRNIDARAGNITLEAHGSIGEVVANDNIFTDNNSLLLLNAVTGDLGGLGAAHGAYITTPDNGSFSGKIQLRAYGSIGESDWNEDGVADPAEDLNGDGFITPAFFTAEGGIKEQRPGDQGVDGDPPTNEIVLELQSTAGDIGDIIVEEDIEGAGLDIDALTGNVGKIHSRVGDIVDLDLDAGDSALGLIAENGAIIDVTVDVGGNLGQLLARDGISGDIDAGGDVGLESAITLADGSSTTMAGGNLFTSGGDFAANVDAGGDIGDIVALQGAITSDHIRAGGDIGSIYSGDGLEDVDLVAGTGGIGLTNNPVEKTLYGFIFCQALPEIETVQTGAPEEGITAETGDIIGEEITGVSIGNITARAGAIEDVTVHAVQDIGRVLASFDITGEFVAEEGGIGDGTDAFVSTAGSINVDARASERIDDVSAAQDILGSFTVSNGSLGDLNTTNGDIGSAEAPLVISANGGVEIDPVTLEYDVTVVDPAVTSGVGMVVAELGDVYLDLETGTSVGVVDAGDLDGDTVTDDILGGIAAPLGEIEATLMVGGHVGGLSAQNVDLDPDSVVMGSIGLLRGVEFGGGSVGNIDPNNPLIITSADVDYRVVVDSGSASVDYSVFGGVVSFDQITYNAEGPAAGIHVLTTHGSRSPDAPTDASELVTVRDMDVNGDVANVVVEGDLLDLSVDGNMVGGGVAVEGALGYVHVMGDFGSVNTDSNPFAADDMTLVVDGFDPSIFGMNVEGTNFGLVQTMIEGGEWISWENTLDHHDEGDDVITVFIENGSAQLTVNNGFLQQVDLAGNFGQNLAVITSDETFEDDTDDTDPTDVSSLATWEAFLELRNQVALTDMALNQFTSDIENQVFEGGSRSIGNDNTAHVGQIVAEGGNEFWFGDAVIEGGVGQINASNLRGHVWNVTTAGDLDEVLAKGGVSGLDVRGDLGVVDTDNVFGVEVNGDAEQIQATYMVIDANIQGDAGRINAGELLWNVTVDGDAASITSGGGMQQVKVGGDMLKLSARWMDKISVGGSVGFSEHDELDLGDAFSRGQVESILGDDDDDIARGGIEADYLSRVSVGGSIGDLLITQYGQGFQGLLNSTVDDAFVRQGWVGNHVQEDGVAVEWPEMSTEQILARLDLNLSGEIDIDD